MKLDFEEDPTFRIVLREHYITLAIWIIQSIVMVGIFYIFGYNVKTDPLGYPLGLPGWYLYGGIIAGWLSLPVIWWVVKKYFTDIPIE